jgi:two-component system nitrate/nitrite response regulator NarL
MISAIICDDHRLFAEAFANALLGQGVQATATLRPGETLAAIERSPVDRVVMNVSFPQASGLDAIRQIRESWPEIHVLCVGTDVPELLRSAMDAGAHAFLSKSSPLTELVETVVRASWTIGSRPAPIAAKAPKRRNSGPRNYPLTARFLTNREREVLQLLAVAKSTERIATEMGISVTTTRGYIQAILEKLGVHSRVEAVTYAVRHSVVPEPSDAFSRGGAEPL